MHGLALRSSKEKRALTPIINENPEKLQKRSFGNKSLRKDLVFMVANDGAPFSMVDNVGFRRFMDNQLPHLSAKSWRTLTRDIEKRYKDLMPAVKVHSFFNTILIFWSS